MRPVAGNLRSTLRRRRTLLLAGTCLVVCFAVYVGRIGSSTRTLPSWHWIDVLALLGAAAAAFVLLVLAWLDLRRDEAALARLHESEARLALLTSQAPADVWTTDTELRLTSVMGSLIAQLENPDARVPGRTLYDVFGTHDPTHPAIAAHLRALKGDSATYERQVGDRMLEGRVEPLRDDEGRVIGCVGTAMDVSTWRWAESQVRRFAALVQASEDAIVSTDLDGVVEIWNPAAERLYGYSADEMLGHPVSVLEPPGRAGEQAALRERLIRGESLRAYDTIRRKRDGTAVEISTHLSPIRDGQGTLVGVSAVIRDITERRAGERQLRLLADALANASDMISVTDADNRFVYVNEAFLRAYGYAREEVLGRTPALLEPSDDVRQEILAATMRGGWSGDLVNRRKDGTEFPVSLSTTVIRDAAGRVLGLLGVARDISERQRAEEARKDAEEHYRVLAENSPDLIARFDARLRHVYVNPAAAQVGKLSASEYVGLTTAEAGVPEPFATMLNERLGQVLRTGAMLDAEDVVPTPEGIRYLLTRVAPELAPDGSVRSVLSFARDITERKRTEEEMARIASFPQMSPMPIAEVDAAGKISFMNPVAERLFEELRTVSPNHPFVADAWTLIDERQGLGTGPRSREVQVGARWYLQDMYVLPDRSHVRIYATDITERRRAEEALRQSEVMFRLMAENASDIISRHAPDGTFLYVSPACRTLLGYDAEELLGRSPLEFVHPDDVTRPPPPVEVLRPPSSYSLTFRFRRKDGRYAWLESRGHAEYDQTTGAVTEVQITSRDVSDRMQVEERLGRQGEELRALARHLESVRDDEHAAMVRVIHDELGQALTALRLDLSWLGRRLPARSVALRRKLDEMTALTDGTIEASRRLVADLRPPILDDLGLVPALEWYLETVEERTKVRARLDVAAEPLDVTGPAALTAYRIVQEALTNVARHAQAKHVTVRLGTRAGALLLEIADDGAGMGADRAYSPRSFGIIGMRERALAHGGALEVGPSPGGGTVVRATIPLEPRQAARGPA